MKHRFLNHRSDVQLSHSKLRLHKCKLKSFALVRTLCFVFCCCDFSSTVCLRSSPFQHILLQYSRPSNKCLLWLLVSFLFSRHLQSGFLFFWLMCSISSFCISLTPARPMSPSLSYPCSVPLEMCLSSFPKDHTLHIHSSNYRQGGLLLQIRICGVQFLHILPCI